MELLRATIRTVRRGPLKHPCFLCQIPLITGQEYVVSAWAGDGSAYSIYEHLRCSRIFNGYMRDYWGCDYEYDRGDLLEVLDDLLETVEGKDRDWLMTIREGTA